ncbi:MAG: hypothetical protein K0S71_186 [Clostridia bacterium]|nr:hypothetical protein [Clostridia bacterium]
MRDVLRTYFEILKTGVRKLKGEVAALYLAYKRRDVPFYAKAAAIIVVGYALSPIDLIPDFIPILGYLDDLILLPLGIWLAVKLIPENIMDECRTRAEGMFQDRKPKMRAAAVIIILVWAMILGLIIYKYGRRWM